MLTTFTLVSPRPYRIPILSMESHVCRPHVEIQPVAVQPRPPAQASSFGKSHDGSRTRTFVNAHLPSRLDETHVQPMSFASDTGLNNVKAVSCRKGCPGWTCTPHSTSTCIHQQAPSISVGKNSRSHMARDQSCRLSGDYRRA
jgi:hypothetical protein